jgi:hypothetical protein
LGPTNTQGLSEVTTMLQPSKTNPSLPMFLLLALLGCSRPAHSDVEKAGALGQVAVVLGRTHADRCGPRSAPLRGALALQNLDDTHRVVIPADELVLHGSAKRSLPPGLYSLEWQAHAVGEPGASAWELQRPPMLNVLPEQATTIVVHRQLPRCAVVPRQIAASNAPHS